LRFTALLKKKFSRLNDIIFPRESRTGKNARDGHWELGGTYWELEREHSWNILGTREK
jgi:hypothetical protein